MTTLTSSFTTTMPTMLRCPLPLPPAAASPYDLTDYHARAMRLVQNHTMITLGQNEVFSGARNQCNSFVAAELAAGNATNAASICM